MSDESPRRKNQKEEKKRRRKAKWRNLIYVEWLMSMGPSSTATQRPYTWEKKTKISKSSTEDDKKEGQIVPPQPKYPIFHNSHVLYESVCSSSQPFYIWPLGLSSVFLPSPMDPMWQRDTVIGRFIIFIRTLNAFTSLDILIFLEKMRLDLLSMFLDSLLGLFTRMQSWTSE